jgi:hypothetical protein
LNNPLKFVDPTGRIYLRVGEAIYYVEDDVYNNLSKKQLQELQERIGKYRIVEEGSIVQVKNGTGIFAPFEGKKVILGAAGKLLEITDEEIRLGTVQAEYDPITPPVVRSNSEIELTRRQGVYGAAWEAAGRHPNGIEAYGGAYRHCMAACLGRKTAGRFGGLARQAWDLLIEDGSLNSRGDMEGEDIGEFLAEHGIGSCERSCMNAYPGR